MRRTSIPAWKVSIWPRRFRILRRRRACTRWTPFGCSAGSISKIRQPFRCGATCAQPGTYRTSGQVRLSDAVHLAGGLAPDAQTEDAQVFRYLPDGKLKIFSVNLEQALAGDPAENILLEPRDRLLIHRNPDAVEPATVNVQGEVGQAGTLSVDHKYAGGGFDSRGRRTESQRGNANGRPYTLSVDSECRDSSGETSAGAATSSKEPRSAQLTAQLTGRHETIAISAALAGDPKSDVALHNGDVLTIRQLPGWNDLGASIRLRGEVRHPGTYGIRPGERLSSVIERAGGFQTDAYPYGAVLQRTQVRELEARARTK